MSKLPNHVITIIKVVGPDNSPLEALGRHLTDQERLEETLERESLLENLKARGSEYVPAPLDLDRWIVDFALLIPEPERMFHGACSGQHPHPHPDGGVYEACWYDWNRNNWGTKWNAYSVERNEGEVRFQTAWSHPYPVIEALSLKFPEVEFDVRYADEDYGSNCGHYTILNGVPVQALDPIFDNNDPESQVRFAVELWGQSWDDYQAEMREYRRQDEEYEAMERDLLAAAKADADVQTAVVKGEVL